jgi:probable F420-dependent oxidoreductase
VAHTQAARQALGDRVVAPEQAMVLAADRAQARELAGRHVARYLDLPNYRRNLERFGWQTSDFEHGGSDALFDALIAWGDVDALAGRAREHLDAGADHVAVHLFTDTPTRLPLAELADLAGALG